MQPSQTASDVAATLLQKGVVKSTRAFTAAALENPDSRKLQPGTYTLRKQMSGEAALTLLLDPDSRLRGRVVVPEGFTVTQTLARIAGSTDIPLAQLQAAAKDTAALGLPSYAKGLEGFLFPATYELEPGTTAVEALKMMVARFEKAAAETGLEERAAALDLTPYEAVVVASLIEREVRLKDELPKVARVVYNRLERGEPLGIDAALLFGLGRTSGAIKQSELESDNPYNLRRKKGLPPTPIASPGEATLQAALAAGDRRLGLLRAGRQERAHAVHGVLRRVPGAEGQVPARGRLLARARRRPRVAGPPLAVAGAAPGGVRGARPGLDLRRRRGGRGRAARLPGRPRRRVGRAVADHAAQAGCAAAAGHLLGPRARRRGGQHGGAARRGGGTATTPTSTASWARWPRPG